MNKVVLFSLLLFVFISCGKNQNEFTSARCFLVINNQEHQDAVLASAMNNMSPGIFCVIKQRTQVRVSLFSFTNSLNQQSTVFFNSKERRMPFLLGYNNGLIIGFGDLSYPSVFYVYDEQCPNCFDVQTIPRKNYPLQCLSNGIAKCPLCKREYNMNTGGNISKGKPGNKLTRYRGMTTGAYGILNVNQ